MVATTMEDKIYKICRAIDWQAACQAGFYDGSHDDVRDGFIHFSTAEQIPGTLTKHFDGQTGLVIVSFEAALLGDALKWEASRGGKIFPHLCARLDTSLAGDVQTLSEYLEKS